MKEVGSLIKIRIHTLMEHEKENTIKKYIKVTNFRTPEIVHVLHLLVFDVILGVICRILVLCTLVF